jgi:glycosyltransferase involved in cell wall biosynthesis
MEISVVIALYNKAPYIIRAVTSVINQEFPPAEIIVVDDGSTDGGAKILLRTISDDRLKVITQANMGECAARNSGIAKASAPFIAFLDADDEWKPNFLLKIKNLHRSFPQAAGFASSAEIVRKNGERNFPNLGTIPSPPWIGIIPDVFSAFQLGYPFNASSIVIKKDILNAVGGFPNGVRISGDVVCWMKIALKYEIAFDPSRLVIYHQDALNRVGNRFTQLEEMPYIKILKESIQKKEVDERFYESIIELIAQKQIFVAAHNILEGNNEYAKVLLKSCNNTQKYREQWLWWSFWATLPPNFLKIALKIKSILRNITSSE